LKCYSLFMKSKYTPMTARIPSITIEIDRTDTKYKILSEI
jgi:hypothetical protein